MKKHYLISGMHCHSCELLLERHLRGIAGVRGADVHHRSGIADVTWDNDARVDDTAVERAVRAAGYQLGTTRRRTWFSHDPSAWGEAFGALCIAFILYALAKILGLTSLSASVGARTGTWVALLVGMTAGVSTCAALIGGLVLAVSARHAELHPSASPLERFRPHLFFNAGRIGGFAVLGAVIGSIGSALQPSPILLGILTLVVGLTMVTLGLKLTELFPRIDSLLALPGGIARRLGMTKDHEYSHGRAALTGALTFFLPCGFTQAMQLAAVASGSATAGALIMGAFALGTAPGLLGIAGLSSFMRGQAAGLFFKVAGIIVVALGVWNLSNGINLTGLVLPSSPGSQATAGPTAEVRDGSQYLTMEQWAAGYNPNRFTIRKGIPFVWTITSTDARTCASSLVVPSLGIRKNLVPGENRIEFTPTRTGTILFSCSMGMFRGSIDVID